MAKTCVWAAGTSAGTNCTLNTPANWTSDTNPSAGDTVIWSGDTPDVTAGLTQTTLYFAAVIIDGTYTGTIGSAAVPLALKKTTNATTLVHMEGSGALYLTGLLTTVNVVGGTAAAGGTITNFNMLGGTPSVRTGAAVTTLNVGTAPQASSSPVGTVTSGVTLTSLRMLDGRLTCHSAITNLDQFGGTCTQSAAVTTVSISGGTLDWLAGNITTINAYGGFVDGSDGTAARVITTLNRFTGSRINMANGRRNITVTTDRYFGGNETLDAGRETAWA